MSKEQEESNVVKEIESKILYLESIKLTPYGEGRLQGLKDSLELVSNEPVSQFSSAPEVRWVDLKERLPDEGVKVFFDGGEDPPAFGRIKYRGKHPYVMLLDSSGEDVFYEVTDYVRWLDESAQAPSVEKDAEIERLKALIKTAHSEGYENAVHHIAYFKSWEEFETENGLTKDPEKEEQPLKDGPEASGNDKK